ncbi:hypothetical protein ILUMI_03870 [Ignelater luminosus]|uniref:Reverse transcriptase domain-containing protein n=1 Tax=Ignelater luminosus TaxID=2038154 RepID=A0A8K0DFF1_IGNLU|nr:hypothetical protein ILUMI_03870 [Ignelater luminosus]
MVEQEKKRQDSVVGSFGKDDINKNGLRLIEKCEQHEMRRYAKQIFSTCMSLRDRKQRTPKDGQQKEKPNKFRQLRYNINSIDQESTKTLYTNRLDNKLMQAHFETAGAMYEYIKQCIYEAAKEALGNLRENTSDQVVIAQDFDDLENVSRKLIEEYTKWELEVNIKKTEYMCVGGQQQDLIFQDGTAIEKGSHYNYLGQRTNFVLWDKNTSKDNKEQIYTTITKSIITYGSEEWLIKDRSEKLLNATEMDFCERIDAPHTITDEIRTKQLIWYGHVQRMSEERLPKQILQWKPHGRRKRVA